MASQYFGTDRAGQFSGVTTGTTTTGKKIELVVDLTGNATRAEVLRALEAIQNYILSNASPFAQ
jgi:hypothetical protein